MIASVPAWGACAFAETLPDVKVVTVAGFRIGVCHGHQLSPWGDALALSAFARKLDVDVLISGEDCPTLIDCCETVGWVRLCQLPPMPWQLLANLHRWLQATHTCQMSLSSRGAAS